MAKHYNINIDLEEIMNGKIDKKLEGINKAIDKGLEKGLRKCEIRIKSKLKDRMIAHDLGTSRLSETMYSRRTTNGVFIGMASKYFMYVEYGTGVIGRGSPHPDLSRVGWRYDVNEHGETGWWYPSGIDDPNPTKYRGENGWWAWTRGQRSRPFMYETWKWAMEKTPQIISDEIGKEVEKLERKMR